MCLPKDTILLYAYAPTYAYFIGQTLDNNLPYTIFGNIPRKPLHYFRFTSADTV